MPGMNPPSEMPFHNNFDFVEVLVRLDITLMASTNLCTESAETVPIQLEARMLALLKNDYIPFNCHVVIGFVFFSDFIKKGRPLGLYFKMVVWSKYSFTMLSGSPVLTLSTSKSVRGG